MKSAWVVWLTLLTIVALGIYGWTTVTMPELTRPHPHPPPTMAYMAVALPLMLLQLLTIAVVIGTPVWISASCWRMKLAIISAEKNNYEDVRFNLFTRGLFIFPLGKYSEIFAILSQLCVDRKNKPTTISSEFSKYIIKDNDGNYGLNSDGKEKMISKVDGGLITGRLFEFPSYFRLLVRLFYIFIVVKIIISVIDLILHHHRHS